MRGRFTNASPVAVCLPPTYRCPLSTPLLYNPRRCRSQALDQQMPDILLVEDKDSLRRVLRLTLENAGYSVTEAADARAASE